MNMWKFKSTRFLVQLTTALIGVTTLANAQNLPNVQKNSLRAPATIKIDGKAKEWDGKYLAYNKVTEVFYSIANDNENLYLAIYSDNIDITTKILQNGINVSFNSKNKSIDKSLQIKYPFTPSTNTEKRERSKAIKEKMDKLDANQSGEEKMSTKLKLNRAIAAENKLVKIFGISSTTDTLFSIYESKDIMVKIDCPGDGLLYYELSVPLKYFGIAPSVLPKLYYNIRLNEHYLSHVLPPDYFSGNMPGGHDERQIVHATDFWGEYTLAK